jgi:uncharacterized phage infection (PIP) family protein YhgE
MSFHNLLRILTGSALPGVFVLGTILAVANPRVAAAALQPTAALPQTDDTSQGATPATQNVPGPVEARIPTIEITPKQRREMLKSQFEKMKEDAEELASLADSLKSDVDKSSENILSLEIMEKAEKIEKLAKRIKKAAKGD